MAVLTCRLKSGQTIEVHKYSFGKLDFAGAVVLGGDKYYIEKAVKLGAIVPEPEPEQKTKRKPRAAK